MKIGILGTSDIAFRRFLPALKKCAGFAYAGVASRIPEKARPFVEEYGGAVYNGYDALLADESIGAVYIPLPPALHFEWGKKALETGKHVLMEKPFTTSYPDTAALLALAEKKGLTVHENYMFLYHSQLGWIKDQLAAGVIGELRLIRAAFGFPYRGKDDFRYHKELGGGALLDCGGYPVSLSLSLLGDSAHVKTAHLYVCPEFNVDLYGNATIQNDRGQVAQISFGMDNSYKCELELWGSKGCLSANRIFTAPPSHEPALLLEDKEGRKEIVRPIDDSFQNSILEFRHQVYGTVEQRNECNRILKQAKLIEDIQRGDRGHL